MFGLFKKKKQEETQHDDLAPNAQDQARLDALEARADEVSLDDFVLDDTAITDTLPEPEPEPEPEPQPQEKPAGLLGRLRQGLSKTSTSLSEGIGGIFTKRKLDDDMLEELEEVLIMADMGAGVAAQLVSNFSKGRFDKDIEPEEVRTALAHELHNILAPAEQPLNLQAGQLNVIMVVGVNGNGKTTTIGKLAMRLKSEGKQVMLAAADTFRAAAVEQLSVWADRADVPIITGAHEADPASVAYAALEQAQDASADVLIIDTAGRLQNKRNLMEELAKIVRVLKKRDESAPHHVMMVLDGTTGQNALSQASTFGEFVDVTGFAVTKLDGTAKGGMVAALAKQTGLPVHFIGVGEGIEDLQAFDAKLFSESLVGMT